LSAATYDGTGARNSGSLNGMEHDAISLLTGGHVLERYRSPNTAGRCYHIVHYAIQPTASSEQFLPALADPQLHTLAPHLQRNNRAHLLPNLPLRLYLRFPPDAAPLRLAHAAHLASGGVGLRAELEGVRVEQHSQRGEDLDLREAAADAGARALAEGYVGAARRVEEGGLAARGDLELVVLGGRRVFGAAAALLALGVGEPALWLELLEVVVQVAGWVDGCFACARLAVRPELLVAVHGDGVEGYVRAAGDYAVLPVHVKVLWGVLGR
jgi:hypothetical protein